MSLVAPMPSQPNLWESWQSPPTRSMWSSALALIESALRKYAQDNLDGMPWEIQALRWDSPSAALVWRVPGDTDVHRSVQVTLSGNGWPMTLLYEGVVWVDTPQGRQHRYWPMREKDRSVKIDDEPALELSLSRDLPHVGSQVQSLALGQAAGQSGD